MEMGDMANAVQLRVIIFKDGEQWVAQCLEYDIGAQAADLDELQWRFSLAVDAEARETTRVHGTPFKGIDPAPRHFHDLWDKRSGEYKPTNPVSPSNNQNFEMEG